MNYNKKALIIGALIMMALPNAFIAMEKEIPKEPEHLQSFITSLIENGQYVTADFLIKHGASATNEERARVAYGLAKRKRALEGLVKRPAQEELQQGPTKVLKLKEKKKEAMEVEEQPKLNIKDIKNKYLIISGSAMPLWARIKNTGSEETFDEPLGRRDLVPPYNKARPMSVENLYKQSMHKDRILFTREEPLFIPLNEIHYPLRIRLWDFANKDKDDSFSRAAIIIDEEEAIKMIKEKGLIGTKFISNSWDFITGVPVKLEIIDADITEDTERPGFDPKILFLP